MAKEATTRLSREEVAKLEVGQTDVSPGVKRFLVVMFLAVVFSVPLAQHVVELAATLRAKAGQRSLPQLWEVARVAPTRPEMVSLVCPGGVASWFRNAHQVNARMLRHINEYEDALEDNAVFSRWIIPFVGNIIVGILGSLVFGFLFGNFNLLNSPILNEIVGGTIGAVILLFLIGLFKKAT